MRASQGSYPLLFAATLFVSALLLFLVQPMVGKMILPALGGTPAVWNTCMVFFQAALLAGYAFTHFTVTWLGVRRQAVLQVVLLVAPMLVLPIVMDTGRVPVTQDSPAFWLLGRLLIGVGLPFFVVSTNAPLLQRWFAQTGHSSAGDPYFLYVASNLGSLLALLGYPVVVEPLLPIAAQSQWWADGYRLLAILVLVCAVRMWRSRSDGKPREEPALADARVAIPVRRRVRWVAMACIPSSLMLGVTTHVTTDIAPVPLLWVVPLALYLLTFILVFARRPPIPHRWMVRLLPLALVPTAVLAVQRDMALRLASVPIHLVAFFLAAMVCHGELAADRPAPRHLTGFYLWMSVGGVLGGLFNALVAPVVFDSVAEYPLAMVLACLVLTRRKAGRRAWAPVLDVGLAAVVGVVAAVLLDAVRRSGIRGDTPNLLTFAIPAILCLLLARGPLRLGLGLGAVLLASTIVLGPKPREVLYAGRNFYGVKTVRSFWGGRLHMLLHGSTAHGVQFTSPDASRTPSTYFHRSGPIGDVFAACQDGRADRVAVIGLGAGTIASYAKPGQHFRFHEIDPEVERIARDTRLFTYLGDCEGSCEVVLGDGRLTLAEVPDAEYGLIILDAFSSDAVPAHLLTREALRLYVAKLAPHGLLVFHITNHYLDLGPLLANLAQDAGLVCLQRDDREITEPQRGEGKFVSRYAVLARHAEDLRALRENSRWQPVVPKPDVGVWTDQYTNLVRLLKWPPRHAAP